MDATDDERETGVVVVQTDDATEVGEEDVNVVDDEVRSDSV